MLLCHQSVDLPGSGEVMLAHDTRPSAKELMDAAQAGVESLGCIALNAGLLTTPQLHWAVRSRNLGHRHDEAAYLEQLAAGFAILTRSVPNIPKVRVTGRRAPGHMASSDRATLLLEVGAGALSLLSSH